MCSVEKKRPAGLLRTIASVLSFDVIAKFGVGLTAILLIRYLEPAQYAQYTIGLALVGVAAKALSSSINRLYIVVTYDEEGREFSTSHYVSFQLLCIGVAALVMAPVALKWPSLFIAVVGLAAGTCMYEMARSVSQRRLDFAVYSRLQILGAFGTLILISLLLFQRIVTPTASHVLVIKAVVVGGFGLWSIRAQIYRSLSTEKAKAVARNLVTSEPRYIVAYFLLLAVFAQTDVLALSVLSTTNEVASYGAAFRYYSLLNLALGAVHAVQLPLVQTATTAMQVRGIIARTRLMFWLLVGPVVAAAVAATWVLPVIDGGKYPASVSAFHILAISSLVSLLFSPHINVLLKAQCYLTIVRIASGALAVNIILTAFLVLYAGAVGAAVGTLVAYAVLNIQFYRKSLRILRGEHQGGRGPAPSSSNLAGAGRRDQV